MSDKWEITKHVCRACFGRILIRQDDKDTLVRCSDCGIEMKGDIGVKDLCACGATLETGRNAGIRCEVNPDYLPGSSQEIIAIYRGRT